ncbi:hypothetical protein MLD38_023868 [Melastoma candidum]|uniref:Uncharacterized protein n=1 Tax=Melastoma candidum TaxID=119954 RepID=A0ACB9NTX3_9MYRT|nr:hypothetical protein MLD38_023868 [Melastoma candidum]
MVMEPSLASLAFGGSILEAISLSKAQKKLFVVYISGDNADSEEMENSTWKDGNVSESVKNYCILLHIPEKTTDAENFSKMYPQNSVPCVTAVGHNGVKLWTKDGFVSPEDLASNLEKAWLSLQIQETTASFLTAAMAARNPVRSTSSNSITAAVNRDNSSSNSHLEEVYGASDGSPSLPSDDIVKENIAQRASSGDSSNPGKSENLENPSSSEVAVVKDSRLADSGNPVNEVGKSSPDVVSVLDSNLKVDVASVERDDVSDKPEVNTSSERPASQSSDVYLNIRLPSGASIQDKFSLTDTLNTVKEFVDSKSENTIGSYNFASPYPRKVFLDAELCKTLLELGLSGRQALIVVPHQRGDVSRGGNVPSSYQQSTVDSSSNGDSEGNYSLLKRIFSYVNPFSYLGYFRPSSGTTESEDGRSGYGPNDTLQTGGVTRGSAYSVHPTSGQVENRSRRPTTSRLGSNIHTLKHDEDDARFGDRNAFWNGNSTQYGGDGDSR